MNSLRNLVKTGIKVHPCSPSTQKVEAERPEVQGQLYCFSTSEASESYMRPCLSKIKGYKETKIL